jgi:two-component system sensor histidine kinase DesK
MNATSFDMERSIARCRVFLSLVAILALYVDPTEPTLTRWLPLTGGAFTINRYWAVVLVAHLLYSLTLVYVHRFPGPPSPRLATIASWGDVLFAAAIALVTEGTTSPFYSFFAFAVLAAGLRSGFRAALIVTGVSVGLYVLIVVVSAPASQVFYIVMRAAYIAITGYLVGYLGQQRLTLDARIRGLEADAQREQIARSLHDGYAQALAGVNLRLATCRELFDRDRRDDALAELAELQAGVNREHDELREYIRSLVDLEARAGSREWADATRVSVQAEFGGTAAFVEHVLLILLEGTRNVRRHARARSAAITARSSGAELVLTIDDDGVGFPPQASAPWSMLSRVAECGGQLTLGPDGRSGGHVLIHLPEA